MQATRSRKAVLALSLAVLTVGFAGRAGHASLMTFSDDVDFVAATQSMFAPGGTVASFGAGPLTIGTSLGFIFETKASSGEVQANVDGDLAVDYQSVVKLDNPTNLAINYTGSSSSIVDTFLGAFVNLKGFIDVTIPVPVFADPTIKATFCLIGPVGSNPSKCVNYSLDIDDSFTPDLGVQTSDSDSLTALSPNLGIDILIASVSAGVDLDIVQTAFFTPEDISGTLMAVNENGIDVIMIPVSIGATDMANLAITFPTRGLWTLSFVDLSLGNEFFTNFSLAAIPFIQYTAGLGCGDAGTDSDNLFTCLADGRADTNLGSISLFDTNTFALSFNSLSTASFQIRVVPEPGSLALFVIGLAVLGFVMRRRSSMQLKAA